MSGFISELDYYGTTDREFIEIALPSGTDPSGYVLEMYYNTGNGTAAVWNSFSLGSSVATMGGYDVYVIDSSTPGWDSGDGMGNLYADDALALVDDTGTVLQFVSWEGNTFTASNGSAAGMTSTNIGSVDRFDDTHSLQSDDGGATYYSQSASNEGTIPACFARGTVIDTTLGGVRIEKLRVGDRILTADGSSVPVRWIWVHEQSIAPGSQAPPIRFRKDTFAPGRPTRDLVVSTQHRIAIGLPGQFPSTSAALVPAVTFVPLRGVHAMRKRARIKWWHIVTDHHEVIRANGVLTETMLLGHRMFRAFTPAQRRELRAALGVPQLRFGTMPPALPCIGASAARRRLRLQLDVPSGFSAP
ncbi:Hint domain-containing protein [Primorskyibacter aestuariivivens]|uniref:Hint domain-containing protein n=1 Tax=Primorskyibacter aestuariivivens TaxID=1888912 RepID=UPI0022FFCF9C|nr:Hint domain-containing protein [Primorskyibacter aestuariivivens]MDA7430782.1 Hint domain-containing protein [Primorskyibacter aestuariivivens]